MGDISNPLADLSLPRASADTASIGYYKTSLSSGITVELAASEHAAIYQYSFTGYEAANIVVDVSHVLPSFRGQGLSQNYTSGNISVFSDGHYELGGVYNGGWNRCKLAVIWQSLIAILTL